MKFTADALEHSIVNEEGGLIQVTTPKEYSLSMTEADLRKAAQQALGRPVRVKIMIGEVVAPQAMSTPQARGPKAEEETTQRALAHPDVQRFQELFPDSQVRAVRNLKEQG